MASVVNVKVSEIRPEFQNLEEWCGGKNNVYIGRKGIVFINEERYPKNDSIWANPFKIQKDMSRCDVIKKYKTYIIEKIKNEKLYDELLKLKGKKLGCWCKPGACHGDILVDLINNFDLYFKK